MIKNEDRKEPKMIWSAEELQETTKCYLEMVELEKQKKKFKRSTYYENLSELFGRRITIYPLRIQNIANLMTTINGPSLEGIKGHGNIGGNNREIILREYFRLTKQEIPEDILNSFPEAVKASRAAGKTTGAGAANKAANAAKRAIKANLETMRDLPIFATINEFNVETAELKTLTKLVGEAGNQADKEAAQKAVDIQTKRVEKLDKAIKSHRESNNEKFEADLKVATEAFEASIVTK